MELASRTWTAAAKGVFGKRPTVHKVWQCHDSTASRPTPVALLLSSNYTHFLSGNPIAYHFSYHSLV